MEYSIKNISQTSDGGKSFVGVSNLKDETTGKTQVIVPYGYSISDTVSSTDTNSIIQLRRYVRVIQKALHSYSAIKKGLDGSRGINSPLSAVNIIQDYLSFGSYIEYESVLKQSDTGKINFNQTFSRIQPQIVDGVLFYDKFITNKKTTLKDNIVALIQENIINHFMLNGGDVLFGQSLRVQTRFINLNNSSVAKHVKVLLKEEQNNTFNTRKQNLIRWSINYIDSLLSPSFKEKGEWNYAIIAYGLWQTIVDDVFGSPDKKKKTQYGKVYNSFILSTNKLKDSGSPTEHDTIYEDDNYVFVIDSKMYDDQKHLLSESVLGKQFGYYTEAKIQNPSKRIINVLLLPHIEGEEGFQDVYIPDPHNLTPVDPDKIIFIYTCSVNELFEGHLQSSVYSLI